MKMIGSVMGFFEIFQTLCFDLDKVVDGDKEYIYKSSSRVRQLFSKSYLCRYPCSCKVLFDNGSEFKI